MLAEGWKIENLNHEVAFKLSHVENSPICGEKIALRCLNSNLFVKLGLGNTLRFESVRNQNLISLLSIFQIFCFKI